MKIKRVEVKNLRGLESARLDMEPKMAIVGPNGSGKSTMLKAVNYGLTGMLPETPIMEGATECQVTTWLDNSGADAIQRKYAVTANGAKGSVKLNRRTTTQAATDEFLMQETGIPAKKIRCITSGEVLSAMKADELGEFILPYVEEEMDFEKVMSYCPSLSREARQKLEGYDMEGDDYLPRMPEPITLADIDKLYKKLAGVTNDEAERKVLKAKLKVLQAKGEYNGPVPTRSEAEIDDDLNNVAENAGRQQMARTALANWQRAITAIERQEEELERLNRHLAALPPCTKPNEAELNEIQARLDAIQNSVMQQRVMMNKMQNIIESTNRTLAGLNSRCCILSPDLVCTTDKSSLKEELEDVIRDSNESISICQQQIATLEEEREELRKKEAAWRENDKVYQESLVLERQRDEVKKNIVAKPVKPEVDESIDFGPIRASLQKEKQDMARYRDAINAQNAAKEVEQDLALVEELVKTFGPKGEFREKLFEHYMEDLEDAMNARAAQIKPDMSVKLVYDDGIHILCEMKPGQGYIPYKSASSGEQILVMFLLIDLLNALTGLRIMMLDDLNQLDKEAFDTLIDTLDNPAVQADYDHILVASVDHQEMVDRLKASGFTIKNM